MDRQIKSHSAVVPADRTDLDWWIPRHQAVLNRVAQGRVDLIFIGDSITHGWEDTGRESWEKYYADRNAVNMGFAGDRTQHVLWRLDNGEIDGVGAKLAVLLIGTNNSNGSDNTAEEIADGIKAICERIRTRLPETKILVLAVFPRGEAGQAEQTQKTASPDVAFNPQWAKTAKASELACQIADNEMIHYLDIGKAFLEENGVLSQTIMPDLLHLSPKGYEIWAEAIEPTVKKLMNE